MTRGSPRKKSTTFFFELQKSTTWKAQKFDFCKYSFLFFPLNPSVVLGEKKKKEKGKISVHDEPHVVSLFEERGTQSYPSVVWTEFRFGWKTECFHGSSKACDCVNHFSLDFHAC